MKTKAREEFVYSSDERAQLIRIAHEAIASALGGLPLKLKPLVGHLSEPRGAFTTLHIEGRLRGCVGFISPEYPLYRTIAETALAAAFQDNRFDPVSQDEASRLKIEISVLSPLSPIAPDKVVVGKHGLVVSQGGRRGLLLPQVAVEHKWDRETFIEYTCRKAGLPPDAYLHGAVLEAFTAEVFGE